MRFYDCETAPSPRRVRIFLAEKGLDVETVQVDLRSGQHLTPEFRALNPHCTVPVLELYDGTCLTDSNSICLYIDESHPEPPLMGHQPKEKAVIAGWNWHCEMNGFMAASEAFRNAAKGLKGRALVGPDNYDQIPELAERGRKRVENFMAEMDRRLADNEFIAGERFSIADITTVCTIDFAGWIKMPIPDSAENLKRWHEAVSARPGCVS